MKIGIVKLNSRIAAPEARCGPKTTNNDEGTAPVLQIGVKKQSPSRLRSDGTCARKHNCTLEQFCKKNGNAKFGPRGARALRLTYYAVKTAQKTIEKRLCSCLITLFWIVQPSFAQQKLDQLLVYGDGFIFGVKEPPGWKGDTASAADFQSNVILHEEGQPLESSQGLIRIRVNDKVDENTSADLQEDIRGYKAQYPKVQFKQLEVKNPHYVCLARVFYVPGEFYEYVTYVNPGRGKPFLFSVAMNSQKSEATAKELEAYREAVKSLALLKP